MLQHSEHSTPHCRTYGNDHGVAMQQAQHACITQRQSVFAKALVNKPACPAAQFSNTAAWQQLEQHSSARHYWLQLPLALAAGQHLSKPADQAQLRRSVNCQRCCLLPCHTLLPAWVQFENKSTGRIPANTS